MIDNSDYYEDINPIILPEYKKKEGVNMDMKIDTRVGLVMEEKTITKDNGYQYRLITIEFEDGVIESIVCFEKNLKFETNKKLEFVITTDEKGKKITGLQEAPEGTQTRILTDKKELKKEEPKHTIDNKAQLYITLNGKTYVTQTGLLDQAHSKGLKSVETELIDFKDQEIAVVKSKVTMKDGSTFTGYGDATKENVNSMIVKHLLRMAETRATNRALRLATNIGVTSIEELGGD